MPPLQTSTATWPRSAAQVSPALISNVTSVAAEEITAWQRREQAEYALDGA